MSKENLIQRKNTKKKEIEPQEEEEDEEEELSSKSSTSSTSITESDTQSEREENDGINTSQGYSIFRRYLQLLKKTLISFILSTLTHVGVVSSYYGLYLYMNPNDEGRKKFYEETTVSPGVNIGGKVVGGGGIQTNHHKSYLFHIIKVKFL
jgi:hypothetical protein